MMAIVLPVMLLGTMMYVPSEVITVLGKFAADTILVANNKNMIIKRMFISFDVCMYALLKLCA